MNLSYAALLSWSLSSLLNGSSSASAFVPRTLSAASVHRRSRCVYELKESTADIRKATGTLPPLQRAFVLTPAPLSSKKPTEEGSHEPYSGDDADATSSRRRVFELLTGGGAGVASLLPILAQPRMAKGSTATTATTALADLPMIRLRLPKGGFGREYVAIQLKIKGEGPFDFMVDSGLTTEMITPHLRQALGIGAGGKATVQGLSAGGSSGEALVELEGVSLCCGKFSPNRAGNELPLPTLHAVVTNFPQEHIDPKHDPVEGMLGMEMLSLFDADFDFPKGRLRLWSPGGGAAAAADGGLVSIPAVVLNETGLLGIRVSSADLPAGSRSQPVVGIIDCGASFSVMNWAAADLLGLPPRSDAAAYRNVPTILGVGIDGRPLPLPTKDVRFTFAGDATRDASGGFRFAQPPSSWRPWDPAKVGIGDLPVFSDLLGDGVTPYSGPAVLIGLDVLSQRRVIVETGSSRDRSRRLLVGGS